MRQPGEGPRQIRLMLWLELHHRQAGHLLEVDELLPLCFRSCVSARAAPCASSISVTTETPISVSAILRAMEASICRALWALALGCDEHARVEDQSHAGGLSGSRWLSTAASTSLAKSGPMVAVESSGSSAMHSEMVRRTGSAG